MKRLLVITGLFLNLSAALAQQSHTVSGYILDSESGEPLIAAAVLGAGAGTVTNNFGYYTITLPDGPVELEFSYMGYRSVPRRLELTADTLLNVRLELSKEFLKGSVVTATHSEIGVRGTQMSAVEVPIHQIKAVPAFGGETDIIKALQLLPGVQSGTEGAAGLYVRGGGPDENLLLLDGVPLYNVNHLFGFFSVFNADAIKNVTLYKGSFPARYGSRLSSVVDVRMKDGNENEIHGSLSVGALAAKFNLEGPIVKGKTTFNVSARRTYYDIFLQPVIAQVSRQEGNTGNAPNAGYYFYDINAKITHRFSGSDRLFLSIYNGDDITYVKYNEVYDKNAYYSSDLIKLRWDWGNTVAALRWNHIFSPKLFMNATVSYTGYHHGLDLGVSNETISNGAQKFRSSYDVDMDYFSGISDIGGSVDFEYKPSNAHEIKFGAQYTDHTFRPSVSSMYVAAAEDTFSEKIDTTLGDADIFSKELCVYAEDNWSATDWLKINFGARYAAYFVSGKTYHSLEPRLSVRALLGPDLSFKASYSEMSQFLHLLSNTSLSLPTDLWVPVTKRIAPMRSRQAAAGLFYSKGGFDLSAEGYWKTMDNVMEYRDGASFLGSTTGWEDKVALGKGWAYGVELLVQKKFGKVSGWVGYTWSRTMRLFDRPGAMINSGRPFPAKYDRIHDLSATLSWEISKRVNFGATFVYGTGNTGSLAMQYVLAPHDYGTRPEPYLESRNNYRMPDYMRADVGFKFYKDKKYGRRCWDISVYNVTNRINPFLVYEGYTKSVKTLKKMSIFPIMPSISYNYEF